MKFNINFHSKLSLILLFFLLGLYFSIYGKSINENMENKILKDSSMNKLNNTPNNCPNMLLEKDGSIYLYNSKKAIIPGVNPIMFKNLEEYSEFVEWQNSQNINCPVLFLQYTTDTQNNDLIQVKESIFENQGGLPSQQLSVPGLEDEKYYEKNKMLDATKNSTPKSTEIFNQNMFSGFDQYNQNVGLDTPLDKIYVEQNSTSANPMDTHWGGKNHTQTLVDQGKYDDRKVYKYLS